jgi:hypothetical protein
MSEKDIDQEVEAIRTISSALQPLDDLGKQRVIDYLSNDWAIITYEPFRPQSLSRGDFSRTSLTESLTFVS